MADERLDVALVARGLARSRNHAAALIRQGRVVVAGRTGVKPATPIAPDASVEVVADEGYVSRAAVKLAGALDAFGVDPRGRVCLDCGASTGGFSQVLLRGGAARVVAIDVGHGQLSAALQPDVDGGRLISLEGVNVRDLDAAMLARVLGADAGISLAVADLSFISLTIALPAIAAAAPLAELVVLIKPQFEVGRGRLREGIVRDPEARADAITRVLWAAHDVGLGVGGLVRSGIVGTHGNAEYLAHLVPGGRSPSEWDEKWDEQWGETIAELAGG